MSGKITEPQWRYEIQYGPDGEANYAWIYRGKEMVATMRTHHAQTIVAALSAHTTEKGEAEPVAWTSEAVIARLSGNKVSGIFEMTNKKAWDPHHVCTVPLYAHPAPPSDLVAEVERLRAALLSIAELDGEDLAALALMDAKATIIDKLAERARAALAEAKP